MLRRIDPMVRLLVAAMLLAALLPVSGAAVGIAQLVANAAVFVLFLLNGLRLPRAEVLAGLGNHRLLIPLVLWSYGAMALAGWALWQAGALSPGGVGLLPPLLGLGFLFLGVLPSTVQSATAYSSLAGGNVASSVVAAALLNLLGVFVTAPLFSLLAGSAQPGFDAIENTGAALIKVVAILLVPFVLGQLLQRWLGGWIVAHRPLVTVMDRSSIAIAVYVAFSGAVAGGIASRIDAAGWAGLLVAVALLLVFAHGGAWLLGKALRLPRGDRIAMLFAGGQKSIAMGAPLATVLFAPEVAGIVLLPILTYHLLQLVLAAPLAEKLNKSQPRSP